MGAYLSAFIDCFSYEGRVDAVLMARVWRSVRLDSRSRGLELPAALVRALWLLSRQNAFDCAGTRSLLRAAAADLDAFLSVWNYPEFYSDAGRRAAAIRGGLHQASKDGGHPGLGRALRFLDEGESALLCMPLPAVYPGARIALQIIKKSGSPAAEVCFAPHNLPLNTAVLSGLGLRRPPRRGIPGRPRLIIGDSIFSYRSASAAGAPFFPIIRGREDECWTSLSDWGLRLFLEGRGAPAGRLTSDFLQSLPATPLI